MTQLRTGSDDVASHAAEHAARDQALVERVLGGDRDAYGELVSRHMQRAFSIAWRILGHRQDAEDVVQDAFIRALERLDRLDRSRPFRPWLYRIVVNQALNYRRGRSVRATEPLPGDAATAIPSPAQNADRALLRDRLRQAMEGLTEKQRTIVQLADLEDFTSIEIGQVLDMPAATVRWHLHQARRALRRALEPAGEET